ncbi:MAG: hypothetical protein U1A25_01250, partial [Candidatus Sungbacteria bacterium]|nr:hypothetical protein [Candidatus Sungbacteria bacterium]
MVLAEASWYYTLSTIPQTMAAMIALAAMFIIFKLTAVKDTIREDLKIAKWFLLSVDAEYYGSRIMRMSKRAVAHEFSEQSQKMYRKVTKGKLEREQWSLLWNEFSDVVDGSHRSFASHPEKIMLFLTEKAILLEKNVESGQHIFFYLIWSIFFSVLPIIFSLIFLPL